MAIGVQWEPTPDWSVGVTYRLPRLRPYEVRQQVDTLDALVTGAEGFREHEAAYDEELGPSMATVAPGRLRIGTTYPVGPSTHLAFEGSHQAPHHGEEREVDRAPTRNARIGALYQVSESRSLGARVSSDRSNERRADPIGQSQLDFWGPTVPVVAHELTLPVCPPVGG